MLLSSLKIEINAFCDQLINGIHTNMKTVHFLMPCVKRNEIIRACLKKQLAHPN